MSIFNVGVSALRTMQRALETTGHNIANVNTEGYSRQRVEITQEMPQGFANGFAGRGVKVVDIKRLSDDFLIAQTRTNAAANGSSTELHDLASQIDTILGEKDSGVATAISSFFSSVQTLADNPSSIPTRQTMLAEAKTVAERFTSLNSRLSDVSTMTDRKIQQTVADVNSLATTIADLNGQIVYEQGRAGGKVPNDLMDQRDHAVDELAKKVGVQTATQDDGSINVMIGSGQSLVVGARPVALKVIHNPNDASRLEVSYEGAGGSTLVTSGLDKGELGGVLRFRDEVLVPAQDDIGRLGVSFAMSFNAQHRNGMDLNGLMGRDVFSVATPVTLANETNGGAIDVSFDPANLQNLTADRYQLRFDGNNYVLDDQTTNTSQVLGAAGSGPFNVAGVTITERTGPSAGDVWELQPVRDGARNMNALLTDPKTLAAASPIKASAANANISDAKVGELKVLDPANTDLAKPVTITFDNPPSSYQIDGAGPFTYHAGDAIEYNGWRLQISGNVTAGDQFSVGSNSGDVGDQGNAKQLAELQKRKLLDGGNATYEQSYAALVGQVGSQTRQADLSAKASSALLQAADDSRQEVSGVNLDEEAANLLRYQQSYQAAARIITTANDVFQSLLKAAGG